MLTGTEVFFPFKADIALARQTTLICDHIAPGAPPCQIFLENFFYHNLHHRMNTMCIQRHKETPIRSRIHLLAEWWSCEAEDQRRQLRQTGHHGSAHAARTLIFLRHIYFCLGPPESNRLCHAGGMKIKRIYETPPHALIFQPTTIARFGVARLVRHFDGPYELIGGTEEERASAREWCSLFAPEMAFSSTPRRNPVSSYTE